MKRYVCIAFAVLLSFIPLELFAQQFWAMAVIEQGKEVPIILEYHSVVEVAENGQEYHRIIDDSYRFRHEAYNPITLQYGYRWADKQMFIYDFEKQKETLGFDFSLSPGDHFTTFNGIEWTVEAAKDTLVNVSFCGLGESVPKRLLTVRTLDGKQSDQWLEDFGSFTNHFMINPVENFKYSQTLWMEYDMGEYLTREISSDPFFAHDSGWLDGLYDDETNQNYTTCIFENGNIIFENVQWWYDHRDYTCFYRDGDEIYQLYSWEMEPHIDGGSLALRKDVINFKDLPIPISGQYIIHIGDNEYSTNYITNPRGDVDGDGIISINDVTELIDLLMRGH